MTVEKYRYLKSSAAIEAPRVQAQRAPDRDGGLGGGVPQGGAPQLLHPRQPVPRAQGARRVPPHPRQGRQQVQPVLPGGQHIRASNEGSRTR